MLNVTKPNEVWILHREDFHTQKEGNCNLYFLLDAFTGHCFGLETSLQLPNELKITELIKQANLKSSTFPGKMVILKKDPYAETLRVICSGLKVELEELPEKYLVPYIKPFVDSFHGFQTRGSASFVSSDEREEAKAFMPETYGPCSCASGQKFKFCCQKAFKSIVFAMCEAQDGRLESALRYMKEAEVKVGRTAEIVCRMAICWSFFDKEKSRLLFQEALSINPNHPRLNYLLGIEAVEEKDYAKAVGFYQKAISNYPTEDKFHLNEAYNNLGTAFYEQGNYKEAKDSWEKALVMLPRDRMVKENLFEFIYSNPIVPQNLREMSPFIEKFFTSKI
jgi:hypothetical protein